MRWGFWGLAALALLLLAFGAWVRLAPTDPDRWHRMPDGVTNRDVEGGAMRVVGAGGDAPLRRLDAIIRDTPRTRVLAGSVEDGMITYVTRSFLWRFPDYTTVRRDGPQIELYGRLRYGRSDLGVNAARLDRWIARYKAQRDAGAGQGGG